MMYGVFKHIPAHLSPVYNIVSMATSVSKSGQDHSVPVLIQKHVFTSATEIAPLASGITAWLNIPKTTVEHPTVFRP